MVCLHFLCLWKAHDYFPRDMRTGAACFPPLPISPILSGAPNREISKVSVRENGVPCITCTDGTAYAYDPALFSWVKISAKWWAEGSAAWQGRRRGRAPSISSSHGIVAHIEGQISEGSADDLHESASKPRPDWWTAAMTCGHLESKLHSAKLLDSPQEYKQALLVYAKRITDEAFHGMAEELIKELFGPVYW